MCLGDAHVARYQIAGRFMRFYDGVCVFFFVGSVYYDPLAARWRVGWLVGVCVPLIFALRFFADAAAVVDALRNVCRRRFRSPYSHIRLLLVNRARSSAVRTRNTPAAVCVFLRRYALIHTRTSHTHTTHATHTLTRNARVHLR